MDDIVEDARRETEVLLSIWENQDHGRSHNHGFNSCNMFVPHAREDSSSSEDSRGCHGGTIVTSGIKRAVGVRWTESDLFIGETLETPSLSTVSPGDIGIHDSSAPEETSLGARRAVRKSSVGDNDKGGV